MASKYLQKYPVPTDFHEILHDFTREVLRDQPPNIIEYAAKYFEMLEKGKKFQYESKFNVKKDDRKNQLQYNPKAAEDITKKASAAVSKLNAQPDPIPKQQAHPQERPQYHEAQTQSQPAQRATPISSHQIEDQATSIKQISNDYNIPHHEKVVSTNTLIQQAGHSYFQDLSKKVEDQQQGTPQEETEQQDEQQQSAEYNEGEGEQHEPEREEGDESQEGSHRQEGEEGEQGNEGEEEKQTEQIEHGEDQEQLGDEETNLGQGLSN